MSKLVSIIIPVFNVEKHIRKSLNSILNQTFNVNDIEVIMVDDCSTDGSEKIIDEYSKKYDNFNAVHLDENSGAAGKPRNIGLEESSCDFVMFLDSDDFFVENAIEVLYNQINGNSELDIVLGGYQNIHGDNKQIVLPFKNSEESYFDDTANCIDLVKINPAISAKIFRTSFLVENNIKFPEGIPGQDLVFFLDAFFNAKNVLSLNNFIVYNRILRFNDNDKSISVNVTSKYILGLIEAYHLTLDVCMNNHANKNLIKLILLSHLQFFTNQIFKDSLSLDDLSSIFNSLNFENFKNHEFFNQASEFRLIFKNIENGIFDNIDLIKYIEYNIKKEIYYNYDNITSILKEYKRENEKLLKSLRIKEADNIYLKNRNVELNLKVNNVESSKIWRFKNLFE